MRRSYIFIVFALAAFISTFAPIRAAEPPAAVFYIGVLSDAHLCLDTMHRYNAALAAAGDALSTHNPPVDFVVHTGDAVDELFLPWSDKPKKYIGKNRQSVPVLALYRKTVSEHFKMTYYDVIGNHEFYWNKVWHQSVKRGAVERMILDEYADSGAMPSLYYSVDRGAFTFVMLDSVSKAETHAGTWVGGFDDAQMDWLEAQLARGRPTLLFFHHYPATPGFIRHASEAAGHLMPESERIYDIIARHSEQIKMIFVGHGEDWVRDTLHGVPVFMSGQPEDTPGFYIVELNSDTGAARLFNESDIAFNTHITTPEPGK